MSRCDSFVSPSYSTNRREKLVRIGNFEKKPVNRTRVKIRVCRHLKTTRMCEGLRVKKVRNGWEIEVGWPKISAARVDRAVGLVMLVGGFIFLLASAIYDSYVAAFVGLGLTFWGALVLLIMPTKYVKLELMTAASSSLVANFQEMLDLTAFNGKGTYLPPNLLRDFQSSLVFIPVDSGETLPKREDIPKDKSHRSSAGLFLIPPGLALSRLFEKKLGKSFTEVNLDQLARELPKLFDELEITKSTLVSVEDNSIIVEARNHVFNDLCEQTRKLERTHEAVGCPFSSAIACALAKAAGKPVTLEKEEQSPDGKTTIQYRILEE